MFIKLVKKQKITFIKKKNTRKIKVYKKLIKFNFSTAKLKTRIYILISILYIINLEKSMILRN
jgi:hypothetical protein